MLNQKVSLPQISTATMEQTNLTADILSRAFAHDPIFNWINPQAQSWSHTYFMLFTEHIFIKRGIPHITSDNMGAAIWLPPNVSMNEIPLKGAWGLFKHVTSHGMKTAGRASCAAAFLEIHHIKEPHYYLHAVGVLPEAQGQGNGSRLLLEMLDRCDHENIPAYLENSNPRNTDLYERHGFETLKEVRLPFGGPPFWPMLRKPR